VLLNAPPAPPAAAAVVAAPAPNGGPPPHAGAAQPQPQAVPAAQQQVQPPNAAVAVVAPQQAPVQPPPPNRRRDLFIRFVLLGANYGTFLITTIVAFILSVVSEADNVREAFQVIFTCVFTLQGILLSVAALGSSRAKRVVAKKCCGIILPDSDA
jgi:hypothetical protein